MMSCNFLIFDRSKKNVLNKKEEFKFDIQTHYKTGYLPTNKSVYGIGTREEDKLINN